MFGEQLPDLRHQNPQIREMAAVDFPNVEALRFRHIQIQDQQVGQPLFYPLECGFPRSDRNAGIAAGLERPLRPSSRLAGGRQPPPNRAALVS
jgi:hypothetical protein